MSKLLKQSLAEGIGTFVMVFAGCGTITVGEVFPGAVAPGVVPLVFGLTVAMMIYAVGHISGAHFNPAVSLAFAASRHFPGRNLTAYWLAQFLGAGLAMFLLWLLLPAATTYGAPISHVLPWQGVIWEALLTFVMMFVIMAVATDTKAEGTMAGVAIGSAVVVGAFFGGPVTGAAMNPARALAPVILAGNLGGAWIYVAGPAFGAVGAALLYGCIRSEADL